ncbi:uncharacterized protein At4g02000-like [Arachis hypogaea]|uniref:uncharacterized protein At4g02000-like n=1 Tax=Arachis hypogaea TaxID=3818 RepID=UPI003B21C451
MGIWGNPKGVTISEVGRNKILISFKDEKKGNQMLKNGPWNIKGNLLNLQRWSQNASFMMFSMTSWTWIQIHGIPVEYMNEKTAKTIGYMLGIVDKVKDPKQDGVLMRNFLRVTVTIEITRLPQTSFWLKRDQKENKWISFKYERFQESYYFNCEVIGHEKKSCTQPMAMVSLDPTKSRYIVELGVNSTRKLSISEGGRSRGIHEQTGEEEE